MHTDFDTPRGELDGLVAPDAIGDGELARLAIEAGALATGQPLSPALREFANLVADRCAALVDDYTVVDRNVGEEIRAAFSLG